MKQPAFVVVSALTVLSVACGGSTSIHESTSPSPEGFSLMLRVAVTRPAGQVGSGQASPLALGISVRDAAGGAISILDGTVVVRDSEGAVLAETRISNTAAGDVSVELAWDQAGAIGRRVDLRLSFLDSDGVVHELERTLAL